MKSLILIGMTFMVGSAMADVNYSATKWSWQVSSNCGAEFEQLEASARDEALLQCRLSGNSNCLYIGAQQYVDQKCVNPLLEIGNYVQCSRDGYAPICVVKGWAQAQ